MSPGSAARAVARHGERDDVLRDTALVLFHSPLALIFLLHRWTQRSRWRSASNSPTRQIQSAVCKGARATQDESRGVARLAHMTHARCPPPTHPLLLTRSRERERRVSERPGSRENPHRRGEKNTSPAPGTPTATATRLTACAQKPRARTQVRLSLFLESFWSTLKTESIRGKKSTLLRVSESLSGNGSMRTIEGCCSLILEKTETKTASRAY